MERNIIGYIADIANGDAQARLIIPNRIGIRVLVGKGDGDRAAGKAVDIKSGKTGNPALAKNLIPLHHAEIDRLFLLQRIIIADHLSNGADVKPSPAGHAEGLGRGHLAE